MCTEMVEISASCRRCRLRAVQAREALSVAHQSRTPADSAQGFWIRVFDHEPYPLSPKCRWQKASLYGWMGGSVCTVAAECYELLALSAVRCDGESEAAWQARQARALAEVDSRLLVLFHALVQARPPRYPRWHTLGGSRPFRTASGTAVSSKG